MFDDYQNDYEQKKSILALLHKMAKTDSKISDIEILYLNDIAKNIGLGDEAVNEVLNNPESYKLQPPPEELERMKILYFLLFMMRVDGKIAPTEEKLIHEAGFRLGFNELLTTDLIGVMHDHLNKDVPPDAMLTQIKKYLN